MTALLLAGLCTSYAHAQTTQPATTQPDLTPLLKQLDNDDWHVRLDAGDKIVALGPSALAPLRSAIAATTNSKSAAVLNTLVRRIQQEDLTAPTLITLHMTNSEPKQVIEAIAHQANVQIGGQEDWIWNQRNRERITINVDQQPFWAVMLNACFQAGVQPDGNAFSNSGKQIGLQMGNKTKPLATCVQGGFVFYPMSVSRQHSIDYEQPDHHSISFVMNMRIFADPKMRILQGPQQVKIDEAVDEKGNSLKPAGSSDGDNAMHASPWESNYVWEVNVPFTYVPSQGLTFKSLKGTAPFLIVTRQEVWTIDVKHLAKSGGPSHSMPIGSYTLNGLQQNGNNYFLTVNSTYDQSKAHPSSDNNLDPLVDYRTLSKDIELTDDQGRLYSPGGGGGGMNGNGQAIGSFYFNANGQKIGPPAKIIWHVPVSVQQIDVPFEFKNVPIP